MKNAAADPQPSVRAAIPANVAAKPDTHVCDDRPVTNTTTPATLKAQLRANPSTSHDQLGGSQQTPPATTLPTTIPWPSLRRLDRSGAIKHT